VTGAPPGVDLVLAGANCSDPSYAVVSGPPDTIFRGQGPRARWRQVGPSLLGDPASGQADQTSVSAMLRTHDGDVFASTFIGGIFRLAANGTRFTHIKGSPPTIYAMVQGPGASGPLYAGGEYGQMWTSTDRGAHWRSLPPLVAGRPDDVVTRLAIDRKGRLLAGLGILEQGDLPAFHAPGVYMSTDRGRSWQPADTGLTDPATTGFLGGGSGLLLADDGHTQALRWNATMTRWTPAATLEGPRPGYAWNPRSLAVVATRPNTAYLATFEGGVFRTRDAGRSFVNIGMRGSSVESVSATLRGEVVYAVRRVLPAPNHLAPDSHLWARVGDLGQVPARCATG
jgi:hypothetical protein